MQQNGFWKKILNVDLSSEKIQEEDLDESLYQQYLGGYGLGVALLFDRIPKGADPLGPENILAFCPGLFTGTSIPFTGRYMVCGKSPLTGGWGDSNSGGYFGPEIKRCGYDAILISGIAKEPKILVIDNKGARLELAIQYWGKDAVETEKELQKHYGITYRIATIGPAGESLSLIAGIVNDKGRIAARSGLGAVMGSKKLKALVLKGNKKIAIKDPQKIMEAAKKYKENIDKQEKAFMAKQVVDMAEKSASIVRAFDIPMAGNQSMIINYMKHYGTSYSTAISAEIGDSPVKNWDGIGYIDFPQKDARELSGKKILDFVKKPFGCFSCPVSCGAILKVEGNFKERFDVDFDLEETHRPEYETLSAFGSLILNHDLKTLFVINEYLNRAGMDSISAGAVVAFAIECYKNGIISKEETNGLELDWNKPEILIPLLKMVVNRVGIGDILADGVKKASERIGKGSEKYAVHAGGQELPMHDPKKLPTLGLTYLADPTPGRHTAAATEMMEMGPVNELITGIKIPKWNKKDPKSVGKAQAIAAKLSQSLNALGFCLFSLWTGHLDMETLYEAVFGWKFEPEEFLEIGKRIQTLRQKFNIKHNAMNTYIHGRAIGNPPQQRGPNKGKTIPVEEYQKEYFKEMGWSETGFS